MNDTESQAPEGAPNERATEAVPRESAQEPAGATGSEGVSQAGGGEADAEGDGQRRRGPRRGRRGGARKGKPGEAAAGNAEDDAQEPGDGVEEARPPVAARPDVGERLNEMFAEVVSGTFDQAVEPAPEEVETEEAAQKRVLRPEPDAPKLHKVLAQSGIGSRRDMEQLILDGQVTVNDEPAHVGMRISYGDQVRINGRPVKVRIDPPAARILAYHKPVGEVVTHDDPQNRPTVFRRLPRLPQGKWQSVGRLDINTEGLLLFTNSGELANQLMHPRFGVEREYAVRVLGTLDEASRGKLLEGVSIEGQTASFKSILDGGGEGANHWYRVVITEGRNREVRKLFDAVGLVVNRLIRVRYGTVVLPRGLKRGVWVELDDNDVRLIRRLAGGERAVAKSGNQQGGQQGGQQGKQQQRGNQAQGQGGKPGKKGHGKGQQGQGKFGGQGGNQGRGGQGQNQAPRGPTQHGDPEFDDGPLHIPNPLEQTFDRRFATGSKRISRGFGQPNHDAPAQNDRKGGPKQPDPMQTSVGYIGADAYFGKTTKGPRKGKGFGRGR